MFLVTTDTCFFYLSEHLQSGREEGGGFACMWGAAQQAGSRLVGIGEKSKRLRRGEISLAKSTLFPCLHCPSLSACVSQSTMLTYFLCFTSSGVEFSIFSCLSLVSLNQVTVWVVDAAAANIRWRKSRTEGDVGRTWLAQGSFVVGMLMPI
jgi:hypothetical protein